MSFVTNDLNIFLYVWRQIINNQINYTVIYFEIYVRCFLLCFLLSCPFSDMLRVKLIFLQRIKSNEVKDLDKGNFVWKRNQMKNLDACMKSNHSKEISSNTCSKIANVPIHHSACKYCVMPLDIGTGNNHLDG